MTAAPTQILKTEQICTTYIEVEMSAIYTILQFIKIKKCSKVTFKREYVNFKILQLRINYAHKPNQVAK